MKAVCMVRDIIVIGASAGGVSALKEIVRSLDSNFHASIFIVLHIPAYSRSNLHTVLNVQSSLPVVQPCDGDVIEAGKIYVATNDHHLLLEDNKVIVKKGPKENRFRPSIDALFRSAASVYGPRTIGIVLSGVLDDGTSGMWSIKRQGGLAIVQDPQDAEHPEMPQNVMQYVDVDYCLPANEIGPLLSKLVSEPSPEKYKFSPEELKRLKMEVIIATRDNSFEMGIMDMGELTPFTCPECEGALVRLFEGNIIRYRCHTGHAYTASSLLAEVTESIESKLWQVLRAMEETTMLLNSIADNFEKLENKESANEFRAKADRLKKRARHIHDSIFDQEQYSEDMR